MIFPPMVPDTQSEDSFDFRIRRMDKSDLEQVREIDRLSFSIPWPAKAYHYELEGNPNSLQWVAELNTEQGSGLSGLAGTKKRLAGLIVVWLILDEAHIATLAVHPDLRGRGIAQKLLSVALLESVQRGATMATLEVRAGNKIAQNLYLRFGFQVVGERPRYYKDNQEDALIMSTSKFTKNTVSWLKNEGWRQE